MAGYQAEKTLELANDEPAEQSREELLSALRLAAGAGEWAVVKVLADVLTAKGPAKR